MILSNLSSYIVLPMLLYEPRLASVIKGRGIDRLYIFNSLMEELN